MSTSKKATLEAIGTCLNSENTPEAKQGLIEKIKPYLGEYAQLFAAFLINYRGLASYRPIQPIKIYLAAVCSIAGNITQKVMELNQTKQRIPMLPELQQFIENSGYSFTLLRGTSHLCEVQISPK